MLLWLLRWIHPRALMAVGLTNGLHHVGDVTSENGRRSRVYSNLKVISKDKDGIVFEGGAMVWPSGSISTGRRSGRIVSLFRDDTGTHFFASTF